MVELPTTAKEIVDIQNRMAHLVGRLVFKHWPMLLVAVIAFLLRIFTLGQDSLSLDELGQILTAENSAPGTVIDAVKHTGNAPLDYLVTHLALFVGRSETVLRFPSVIWGTLAVAMTYGLGREWFNKYVGALAAFLLAITPIHLHYSQIVRFYSLTAFLFLLTVVVFRYAIEKNVIGAWLAFGLVYLFALYAHYYALIIGVMLGLWVFKSVAFDGKYERSVLNGFFASAGIAGLLFLPWPIYDLYHDVTVRSGIQTPATFVFPEWSNILTGFFSYENVPLWWPVLIFLTVSVGAVLGLSRRRFGASWFSLLLLIVLGGIFFVLLFDRLRSYHFAPRQLLPFTPFLLLAFSAAYIGAIEGARKMLMKKASPKGIAVFFTIVMMGIGLGALWRPLTNLYAAQGNPWRDWRATAEFLSTHLRSDDALLIPTPHIAFYLPELGNKIEMLWDEHDMERVAQSHRRIWILFPDIGVVHKRQPGALAWLRKERPVEVFVDPGLPIYIHSLSIDADRLVGELLDAGAYTPAVLVHTDFVERSISAGYVTQTIQTVEQLGANGDLESADVMKLFTKAGRSLADHGEPKKGIDLLSKAIGLGSGDSSSESIAWTNLAIIYSRQRNQDEAISAYRKALALNPDAYSANHLLAKIFFSQEQWDQVIALEQTASKSAPGDGARANSLDLLGQSHLKLGNSLLAYETFDRLLAVSDEKEGFLENVAVLLEQTVETGNLDSSLNIANKLKGHDALNDADKAMVFVALGRSLFKAGEVDRAGATLRQAALFDATNAEAQFNLGLVLKRQGNRRDAIAAYRRALEMDPNHYWANQLLGLLMEKRGDWQEAIRVGKKAAEVSEKNEQRASSLTLVGRASLQLNDLPAACKAFSQAYAIEPNKQTRTQLEQLDCVHEP